MFLRIDYDDPICKAKKRLFPSITLMSGVIVSRKRYTTISNIYRIENPIGHFYVFEGDISITFSGIRKKAEDFINGEYDRLEVQLNEEFNQEIKHAIRLI